MYRTDNAEGAPRSQLGHHAAVLPERHRASVRQRSRRANKRTPDGVPRGPFDPIHSLGTEPPHSSSARHRLRLASKRILDVLGASAFFFLFGWLFAAIWLMVAATHGRPVIYRHRRVGLNGREFDCLKFRSMVRNAEQVLAEHLHQSPEARAEWGRDFKLRDDPRVTPFGKFLRRSSLDELPQFWNVLRGEMSLVGPRPVVQEELVLHYRENSVQYLSVKPGITGPWQTSGRNDVSYATRVAYDSEYASNWTNRSDLMILARTVRAVMKRSGSY